MRFLVDIGNSRAKWAVAEASALRETGVVERADIAALASVIAARAVDSIWIACVAAASAVEPLTQAARRHALPVYYAVSGARFQTLVNGYTWPQRLGVDRWMACIAATGDQRGSVLIADAGTAITLDYVDAARVHQGGLIAPGIASMRATLADTTELPGVHADVGDQALGRDTPAAIATGTRLAAAGFINAVAASHGADRCVISGGQAPLLAPHLVGAWREAPDLVLRGLAVFAEACSSAGSRHGPAAAQ